MSQRLVRRYSRPVHTAVEPDLKILHCFRLVHQDTKNLTLLSREVVQEPLQVFIEELVKAGSTPKGRSLSQNRIRIEY